MPPIHAALLGLWWWLRRPLRIGAVVDLMAGVLSYAQNLNHAHTTMPTVEQAQATCIARVKEAHTECAQGMLPARIDRTTNQ
jgi:hypothetical protein